MISVTQLKPGTIFKLNGNLYQVLKYTHTKLGRGTANIKVKVRHLRNGAVVEKNFISGAKVEPVATETKELQYLYRDSDDFYFMDPHNFEQFRLTAKILGPKSQFLKENQTIKVLFYEEEPLSIELPLSMVFQVVKTTPGVKGNTVSNTTKPATLDNGLVVQVPLFVKKGDQVKIDTRNGQYLARVKSR